MSKRKKTTTTTTAERSGQPGSQAVPRTPPDALAAQEGKPQSPFCAPTECVRPPGRARKLSDEPRPAGGLSGLRLRLKLSKYATLNEIGDTGLALIAELEQAALPRTHWTAIGGDESLKDV